MVWFVEDVSVYKEAVTAIQQANIFIVIGTSLNIYPVAGLIHEIPAHCEAYYLDPQADYSRVQKQYQCLKMTATQGMSKLVKKLTPS